jgi:glycosyltransferase involved in cell wall biosynthesis
MAACYFARHVSADVVHAQFAGPAAATAYSWNALTGIPYTVRAHAYDIYAGYGWLKTVLSSSIGVIAISRDGQEQVERRFGRRSALVRVGIPADGIPARPRSDPQSPFRFLSVGALSEKKGHGLAIKAVQILLADGEQVSLDIYGAGPLRPALTRLIQSTPQIRLRGTLTTSEMRERYQHYDAFLMTPRVGVDNDREGIPVVIMEAMAARLPVACTVVGGMAELVRDGVTGTVLPSDPLAVAERLHRLTDDYPRALALTDDALSTVRSEHELKTNTNALLHLWEEALARSHAT